MGNPARVVSTEIWQDGRAVSTVLEYATGARCIATWIDLPNLWDFKETLEIYGDDKRVILSYPTGFSRGQLSAVTVRDIDDNGASFETHPAVDWESPFVAELRHFHACVTRGVVCRTPLSAARHYVQLVVDIARAGLPT